MPDFTSVDVRAGTVARTRIVMCCLGALALPADTATDGEVAGAMRLKPELALGVAYPECQQGFVHDLEYADDAAGRAAHTRADAPSTEPAEAISGR
jgi:hypothetical protein